jgi:hypothetical protein
MSSVLHKIAVREEVVPVPFRHRQYKEAIGSVACTDCAAGKFLGTTGASVASTCTNCCAGMYSVAQGASEASTCVDCGASTHSATTGASADDTYTSCPPNSQFPSGSSLKTRCQCHAGYTGPDGGNCSACEAGQYKEAIGSVACTDCVAGKFLGTTGGSMDSTCTDCGAGTYSTTQGASEASTCDLCPANSSSPQASTLITDCTCNAGATAFDGATCMLCEPGKYKASSGSATCTDCPVNSISFSTNCQYISGFMADGGTCSACSAGKFKSTTGTGTCTTCPEDTSSAGSVLTNPSESLRTLTSAWGERTNSALGATNPWCIADYYQAKVMPSALATTSQYLQIDRNFRRT